MLFIFEFDSKPNEFILILKPKIELLYSLFEDHQNFIDLKRDFAINDAHPSWPLNLLLILI